MTSSVIQRPAYEWLAIDIKNAGVTSVFGLMSDDTALLVATLDGMGVRFYGARHENNAVAMAEGYAAATGETGIVILGRGPATANGLHGVTYAQRSGSRVLIVLGEASVAWAPPSGYGPDSKGFNSTAVLNAAGVKTIVATESGGARQALATALAATAYGAVALLLPMNVQYGAVEDVETAPRGSVAGSAPKPTRAAAIDAAADILKRSQHPVFVAGLGAHRAGARDALIRLADKVGACTGTTFKAKDMFRGYAFDVGIIGSFSHAGGRRLIDQADCIVAFGAGLNQRTTSFGTSLPNDVPLIHVDTHRENIGRWFHADVAVVADVKQAAEQLFEVLPPRSADQKPLHGAANRQWLADFKLQSEFEPANTPRTMDPRSLALELDRLLPTERNIVYDSGNFLQIAPYISVPGPAHIKHAGDFSSIGMGFGTALGFACARVDQPTVLFVGDGSFLMTLGELETAVREDIPLIIVVMNDGAYGAELHYLKMRSMPVAKSVFADLDFAPIAQAVGFQAETVRTLDELRALEPLLASQSGPILLDCKINASVAAPFLLETIEYERRKR
ncbi:thiamine pyrophosphate-binding protein [Paraburkholderia aspalathi]|uniref:Acetolactate synthase large subunit n=1 Tax=Paraburkholderia aspalathi TaxID=1324617 RepID=A0A1I7DC25_9BURK|nr:thiamine pyrophosphate-binding protein [Paraburkholderia aspalathi]SFU09207.1 Acetolactate synthase large subunit [Paraburkholderia aspalathi]